MKIQGNKNAIWEKFNNTKSTEEKKKILDEMINPPKEEKEEDSNLTPREMEMKKQIRKLNSKDIASKVARGEYVNDKDLKNLEDDDSDLLIRAKYMNIERKRIENEVKNARTKKIGKEILANERQAAIGIAMAGVSNGDNGVTGIAMISAVDKAEENSSDNLKTKEKAEKEAKIERDRKRRINKLI